ncbi:hypothetical protein D3C83_13710 [compost metagenome]
MRAAGACASRPFTYCSIAAIGGCPCSSAADVTDEPGHRRRATRAYTSNSVSSGPLSTISGPSRPVDSRIERTRRMTSSPPGPPPGDGWTSNEPMMTSVAATSSPSLMTVAWLNVALAGTRSRSKARRRSSRVMAGEPRAMRLSVRMTAEPSLSQW